MRHFAKFLKIKYMKINGDAKYLWICLAALLISSFIVLKQASQIFLESNILALATSIQDDSFYYIIPSFNFAHGHGFTFGGEKAYGFQIGYALLLAFIALFITTLSDLLRVSLLLNAFLFVSTAFFVFFITIRAAELLFDKDGNKNATYIGGLVAAIIYLSNYWNFFNSVTAKENALAASLVAALIYLTVRTDGGPLRWRSVSVAGFLYSLLFLTRPVPATLLYGLVFLWFYRGNYKLFIGTAMIIPAVWAVFAEIYFGSVVPFPILVKAAAPTVSFGPEAISKAWEYCLTSIQFGVFGPSKVMIPQQNWHEAMRSEILGILIYLGLWIFSTALFVRLFKGPVFSDNRVLVIIFCLAASVFGSFVMGLSMALKRPLEIYYASWYFYDSPVMLSVLFGAGVFVVIRRFELLAGKAASYLTAIILMIVLFLNFNAINRYFIFHPYTTNDFEEGISKHRWGNVMVASGIWLMEHRDDWRESRVSAFSSGALGFVLEDRVINLDGLANNNVATTLLAKRPITDYILKNRPGYFVNIVAVSPPVGAGIRLDRLHTMPFPAYDGYQISQFNYTEIDPSK